MKSAPLSNNHLFWRGFRAVLPLWLAVAPFTFAFVVAARQAGLGAFDIQLSSLSIYSGAAQIAVVQMLSDGVPPLIILVTTFIINAHFVLYGLSLSKRIPLSSGQKVLTAYMLTDVAYGITIAKPKHHRLAFLLGAATSMFVAWNGFTLIGILSSQLIQTSILNHLEFIVPLTFFMLLMSSIHSQLEMGVAVLAGGLAFVCLAIGVGRVTLLVVAVTVPLVAVLMSKHTTKTDA